ncbi:MAG: hypothetical protein Q8O37_00305 [Sulfuricellaceae bacterium]|nr:hypothetical protein [Sulfuricellaceae bacterium]
MNAFKRKSVYLAVAAGLGAVGVAGSAAAVNVSPNGLGEVLIYPYYTVRGGTETYMSIVNTTASAKAVKVRFTEGKNSREVLDFNLYMSPYDMWTGAVVATATGAKLITADKSCTAPAIPATGADFVNFAYSGTFLEGIVTTNNSDGENQDLDRTREGYFEVIEMGVITNAAHVTAVTHVAGVPANCAVVNTGALTVAPGMGTGGGLNALVAPTGGLAGTASLLNGAAGTDFGYDPVALASFSDTNIWNTPGSILPDLRNASPANSLIFKNGAVVDSTWLAATDDAVTAVLMHDNIINEFVLDTATLSGTDWVVTMPTKRYNVPVDNPAVAPAGVAIGDPFTTRFFTGGACEPVGLAYYNREEGTQTSGVIFSPPPSVAGNALCWESTVITFNNSNVLSSVNGVNVPIAAGFQNGWLRASFGLTSSLGETQTITSVDGNVYIGLPTVGFMVQDFVNGNVGGVLSNYGGNFNHKYTTMIDGVSVD